MGRLIDVDEVKKRYPIMENDFGMVINESLHKDLDKIPTVEAISKADMITILDKIRAEIKEMTPTYHNGDWSITDLVSISEVLKILDKYKVESED